MLAAPLAAPPSAPSFQQVDPDGSLPVDAHALWNRFRQELTAALGPHTAERRLQRGPAEPLRAVRYFLARGVPASWRFRSLAEATLAGCDDAFEPLHAPCATDAMPGTPEKLAVFRARLARGEELFAAGDPYHHPDPESARHLVEVLNCHCYDLDRAELERLLAEAEERRW